MQLDDIKILILNKVKTLEHSRQAVGKKSMKTIKQKTSELFFLNLNSQIPKKRRALQKFFEFLKKIDEKHFR